MKQTLLMRIGQTNQQKNKSPGVGTKNIGPQNTTLSVIIYTQRNCRIKRDKTHTHTYI